MPTILITTDYLTPGDEVDNYLTGLGFTTRHDPMGGPRRPEELIAALAGHPASSVNAHLITEPRKEQRT